MKARVGIVGAGIGGLTLAAALSRAGFEVEVFEARERANRAGSGITLAPNALSVLRKYDLSAPVLKVGEPQREGRILWQDGTVLSELPLDGVVEQFGSPILAFHRFELSAALESTIPPESLHFGKRVEGLTDRGHTVEIAIGRGEIHRFDLVIVADGLHSRMRDAVLGERRIRYSGQTSWRGMSTFPVPGTAEVWGAEPGLRFGFVPLTGQRTYFFATKLSPPRQAHEGGEKTRELLTVAFSSFPEIVRDVIRSAEPSSLVHTDIEDIEPRRGWSKGRICFLGDAVHATTPNLGQGACQAIESAGALAELMARGGAHEEIFREYEARRFDKAKFVTDTSLAINKLLNMGGIHGRLARRYLMSLAPRSAQQRNLARLYTPS